MGIPYLALMVMCDPTGAVFFNAFFLNGVSISSRFVFKGVSLHGLLS